MNKWILYVGGFELPDKNAAAQRVVSNGKAFRELGYNAFFVGLSKTSKDNVVKEYEKFEYINLSYPKTSKEWYMYLTSIRELIQFLQKKPDLIIAYNYPAVALNKLRKWSKKYNIPLIADCTEWYEAQGNVIFRAVKSFDTYYRMKVVQPKLDGMIAISSFLYDFYKKRMDAVIKVPPLVDLSMSKWNIQSDVAYKNDKIKLIYAGSPGSGHKDRLDLIFDALAMLEPTDRNKFSMTIIGLTKNEYEVAFNKNVAESISDMLFFKGRLSHVDTLAEIKASDINVFFRDTNLTNTAGFPTKFAESISCGTPVLTNKTSNIEDYLVDGNNGFFVHPEVNFIANKLCEISLLSRDKLDNMKKECINSRLFDYKNYINDFLQFLIRIQDKQN